MNFAFTSKTSSVVTKMPKGQDNKQTRCSYSSIHVMQQLHDHQNSSISAISINKPSICHPIRPFVHLSFCLVWRQRQKEEKLHKMCMSGIFVFTWGIISYLGGGGGDGLGCNRDRIIFLNKQITTQQFSELLLIQLPQPFR